MESRLVTETFSENECQEYLGQAKRGRVAVTAGVLPAIFPVAFVLDSERLLIRVPQDSPLCGAVPRAVVAFSADHFDEETGEGWAVLVVGLGSEVVDEAPQGDCVLSVPLTFVSGTRAYLSVGSKDVGQGGAVRHPAPMDLRSSPAFA